MPEDMATGDRRCPSLVGVRYGGRAAVVVVVRFEVLQQLLHASDVPRETAWDGEWKRDQLRATTIHVLLLYLLEQARAP